MPPNPQPWPFKAHTPAAETLETDASLHRDEGVRLSTTGAVLGHPGAEHGAYGMLSDAPDGVAHEREVRGVEVAPAGAGLDVRRNAPAAAGGDPDPRTPAGELPENDQPLPGKH